MTVVRWISCLFEAAHYGSTFTLSMQILKKKKKHAVCVSSRKLACFPSQTPQVTASVYADLYVL